MCQAASSVFELLEFSFFPAYQLLRFIVQRNLNAHRLPSIVVAFPSLGPCT
jgi:hypothetical protein